MEVGLRRFGACPGCRKTTSSAMSPSTVCASPAFDALIHFDTNSLMACSSVCILSSMGNFKL
jgi:hypothetical protein